MVYPTQLGFYVHQWSAYKMLDGKSALTDHHMRVLLYALFDADAKHHSTIDKSYRHAMTDASKLRGVSEQERANARQQGRADSNTFVAEELSLARTAARNKKVCTAMIHLGYAMHCLQDSCSPAHGTREPGAQVAAGNTEFRLYDGGEWHSSEMREHVHEEGFFPGNGSWLDQATVQAYHYYTGHRAMPANGDFFLSLGVDVYDKKRDSLIPIYGPWFNAKNSGDPCGWISKKLGVCTRA